MRKVCLIFFSLLSWAVFAQKVNPQDKRVTVLLNHISLGEALTVMGISYGVQFSYSDDIVPTQVTINLAIQNETLPTSLEKQGDVVGFISG